MLNIRCLFVSSASIAVKFTPGPVIFIVSLTNMYVSL